jgi:ribose-phosphate pyrophosphokinase
MKPMLFSMPGSEDLVRRLGGHFPFEAGELQVRRFPDRESYLRYLTPVKDRHVILAARLHHPDEKTMSLYLAARVARELGAKSVGLIVPYLPYMRQDKVFQQGEGITSLHFASFICSCTDWLVTVDPHLHRHPSLSAIYSIDTRVVTAAGSIAHWIAGNVDDPIIIGPDEESRQWVQQVATMAACPCLVMEKKREGDRKVTISVPDLHLAQGRTPILLDDIVSTARTMVAAAAHLKAAGMKPPICIAVHALFCDDAYAALQVSGTGGIVSCNTVPHSTNQIEIEELLAAAVKDILGKRA